MCSLNDEQIVVFIVTVWIRFSWHCCLDTLHEDTGLFTPNRSPGDHDVHTEADCPCSSQVGESDQTNALGVWIPLQPYLCRAEPVPEYRPRHRVNIPIQRTTLDSLTGQICSSSRKLDRSLSDLSRQDRLGTAGSIASASDEDDAAKTCP